MPQLPHDRLKSDGTTAQTHNRTPTRVRINCPFCGHQHGRRYGTTHSGDAMIEVRCSRCNETLEPRWVA